MTKANAEDKSPDMNEQDASSGDDDHVEVQDLEVDSAEFSEKSDSNGERMPAASSKKDEVNVPVEEDNSDVEPMGSSN